MNEITLPLIRGRVIVGRNTEKGSFGVPYVNAICYEILSNEIMLKHT